MSDPRVPQVVYVRCSTPEFAYLLAAAAPTGPVPAMPQVLTDLMGSEQALAQGQRLFSARRRLIADVALRQDLTLFLEEAAALVAHAQWGVVSASPHAPGSAGLYFVAGTAVVEVVVVEGELLVAVRPLEQLAAVLAVPLSQCPRSFLLTRTSRDGVVARLMVGREGVATSVDGGPWAAVTTTDAEAAAVIAQFAAPA